MSEIAVRYASALAESAGLVGEEAEQELLAISRLFNENESLRVFFESPGVETSVKLQKIKAIFSGKCQTNVLNLLLLLTERNRLPSLYEIATAFTSAVDKRVGRVPVSVTVSGNYGDGGETLSPDYIAKVEAAVAANKKEFGIDDIASPKFKTSVEVKPEILAGIKIRVGDNVYDGSAGTGLRKWRDKIIHMPIDTKGTNWFSE